MRGRFIDDIDQNLKILPIDMGFTEYWPPLSVTLGHCDSFTLGQSDTDSVIVRQCDCDNGTVSYCPHMDRTFLTSGPVSRPGVTIT